jgi:putative ABC transport system substrate-binding protein
MDRRTFIGAVTAGVIAAPLTASAQTAITIRRIGLLSPGAPPTPANLQLEYAALGALGWVVGQNLLVERRDTNNRDELLRPFAEELVRLNVEIIMTNGTAAALAAKNATTTIPIVFVGGDPVLTGLVASLARPGGNITGVSIVGPEINAKRLTLVRELLPDLQRVGVLENSTNPYFRLVRKELERACLSLGMQPIIIEVTAAGELEGAIAELARRRAQALLLQPDGLLSANLVPIVSAASRYALPTIGALGKDVLAAGALASYTHSEAETGRRYAAFVDRILRGAKPADLPIEQPTKFELGINLKVAKMFGITVPQSLLLRADEVIR